MPDPNPDAVSLLSDDALQEIEVRPSVVIGGPEMVLLTPTERDALCATVLAMRPLALVLKHRHSGFSSHGY